jgi:glycosyltransferase involved in cell wall biosynthesis
MKIVNLSYAYVESYNDPHAWLERIRFFTGLLERMTPHAEVVSVHNIQFKGSLEEKGVTYLFPAFNKRALQWGWRFNKYILSLKPDVVMIQGFSPWQIFLLGFMNPGLKIMVQHRAEKPFRGIKRFLQKKADKYIGSYFFSAADLADNWIADGQIENKAKIVEALGMSSTFGIVDKELAISNTRINTNPAFLWVGDLDPNKNPLLAVEAFIEFVKQEPTAMLVMIYRESAMESTLQARIRGLEASIKLVGKVPYGEMINWYNSVDFILSTSYYESAGLSVCEGMSCGCIPVVTDIQSFRMMTDHGRVGLLFEPGDKSALVTVLEKCASIDRASTKEKVLRYFQHKLSFDANVSTIMGVAK